MLKQSEIYRLVNDYIGVSGGYLNGFSYGTHYEFYAYYCDLEIKVADYEPGTTREKFIRILEEANSLAQAKILKGVFKKFPVSAFEEQDRQRKQEIYDEYQALISGLDYWVIPASPKHHGSRRSKAACGIAKPTTAAIYILSLQQILQAGGSKISRKSEAYYMSHLLKIKSFNCITSLQTT